MKRRSTRTTAFPKLKAGLEDAIAYHRGGRKLTVKLDSGMRARLQALAQAKRRSPHRLMVEAIRLYVEREEAIERARAETRERLARYDATGEYIADEDVQAWLETWGTPSERRPPTGIRKVRTR